MTPRLVPLPWVYGAASMMADELRAVAKSRPLVGDEPMQLATMVVLETALAAAARQDDMPRDFASLARFDELFAAADKAARTGGIAVPRSARRHPFPITAAALAWFAVSGIADSVFFLTQNGPASEGRERLAQLRSIVELRDALDDLAHSASGDPAALQRVETAFANADQIVGDQLAAIITEAATIATASAAGRLN